MHFKPMIAAALVMSLSLVANGVPIDSVAPVADVAPIVEATPVAPVANVAPVAPADGIAPVTGATTTLKGMGVQGGVEGILWPAGFTRQCIALDKASKNLAILIERAKKESGYKCNRSQTEIINRDAGMHFKSMIAVALVMSPGLVANAAPVTDVEPAINGECNALYAITVKLDKQIARAKAKRNYSCTAAQLKEMLFKSDITIPLLVGLGIVAAHGAVVAPSEQIVQSGTVVYGQVVAVNGVLGDVV
ncbi:hypothetical protein BGX24_010799 [Mortierella sp. AD032]|nr:hypothetical protein BGX24_010799 [Mortierella sp. AD032]